MSFHDFTDCAFLRHFYFNFVAKQVVARNFEISMCQIFLTVANAIQSKFAATVIAAMLQGNLLCVALFSRKYVKLFEVDFSHYFQVGTYTELVKNRGAFAEFLKTYATEEQAKLTYGKLVFGKRKTSVR